MLRMCASSVAISSAILAQAVTDLADGVDQWKAISELGIAVVFASVAFFGMGAYIRRMRADQREDSLRRDARISQLEVFQQNELLEMTKASTSATVASCEATRENTAQLVRMTEALSETAMTVATRPCAAIERLPDAEKAKVWKILKANYAPGAES